MAAGTLGSYRAGGMYAVAVLRSISKGAKSDAYLGRDFERALTEEERKALRKVARLTAEAVRILEGRA